MKTSLKKLQKLTSHRHDKRAQKHHQSLSLDEHARATQDLIDMRGCYDRLLSAAAATANSVYEFSESLREMGDCLLEKTALNDDEESGKVLLMLGKVQFELQKLVDGYRSHIFQTITIPSESLLNELRIVEEMKKRCDEKREIYEDLVKRQKEKLRLRSSKTECFTSHQLQEAHDEYDEEANVFVFRMKSLKQGQSRSFLTQSSRHHAAQLYFFKRAVRSLEAIEPHVSLLAEQLHIDYHFSGLYEDGHEIYYDESDDDTDDGSESHDDGELSFDYGQNGAPQEVSALKNSMELDNGGVASSPDSKLGTANEISRVPRQNSYSFQRGVRAVSKSAPLFPPKKFESSDRTPQIGPSPSRKYTSYVLPTPDETKSPSSGKSFSEVPQTRQADFNLHHSSPVDPNKYEKLQVNVLSGPIILDTQSVLKESNNTPKPSLFPPKLSEAISLNQPDPNVASYAKKAKRQAFSGPLTGKPWPNNPHFTSSGPISSSNPHFTSSGPISSSNPHLTSSGPISSSSTPPPFSGSILRTVFPRPTSTPKISSHVSPIISSPKISELHELPRPPTHLASRKISNRYGHSGPLLSKSHELSTNRGSTSVEASKLPIPPLGLSRSYSIPAGGPMEAALHSPREGSQNLKMAEHNSSPPLMPISLPMPNQHPDNR